MKVALAVVVATCDACRHDAGLTGPCVPQYVRTDTVFIQGSHLPFIFADIYACNIVVR